MSKEIPFWQKKNLSEMSADEWDSLCDGCAKCCLHKIEDEDDGEIFYTNIACRQLDLNSCRCNNYAARTVLVSDCVELKSQNISSLTWLPSSCAYRLLDEGKDLPWWHPLITGELNTIHTAGISVKGRCVAESDILDLNEHIVNWPNEE